MWLDAQMVLRIRLTQLKLGHVAISERHQIVKSWHGKTEAPGWVISQTDDQL